MADDLKLSMEWLNQYRPNDAEVGAVDSFGYKWAFSGADIHAYIGNRKVANLVALSVNINREIAPIYTFGNPSPRTFVKGRRGIAGTMTFTQFDKHALLEGVFSKYRRIQDIWELVERSMANTDPQKSNINKLLKDYMSGNPSTAADQLDDMIRAVAQLVASRHVQYVDQLPPFDLTLVFINESGAFAHMALTGVQFANEGYGYTLDDLSSAIAVTYVATGVRPLTNVLASKDMTQQGTPGLGSP